MNVAQRLIAQIPTVPINEVVDVTEVSPWDILWAVLSLIIGYVLGRLSRRAIHRYGSKVSLAPNVVDLLSSMAMWMFMLLAVVAAASFLGFAIAPLWVAILIVLVVVFIAGQPFIANFGSGIILQARAPFEPGDLVQLEGHMGVVKEVNTRVVVIDTFDHRRVFLPNSQVLGSPIVNLTHRRLRMSFVLLDVEYGTDLERARQVVMDSLKGIDSILSKPEPVAEVRSFEASSVRISLRFWHKSDLLSEWTAIDEAARASYRALYAADIKFAFPQATLWWGDNSKGERSEN